MKKTLILASFILCAINILAQTPYKGADYIYYYQLGTGKTNGSLTHPSAWLEVGKDSTNKGFRMPRVVDTANIASPAYGLQVYQIKDNGVYFRDKFGWRRMIDPGSLSFYLLRADSTIFYPYWSNPRNYISTELDPNANAKTVRWIAGTGINVSNGTAQPLATNPVATISAQNTTAIWNANQFQGVAVSAMPPTSGQVLQYNGTQYVPSTPPPSGTVNSVGLSLPSIFSVTGSPVTTNGTLTASFQPQLQNLIFASPNGISGNPSFRSFSYSDMPLSGVGASIYGNDTNSVSFTVNNRGIITNATSTTLSNSYVRRQNSYIQPGGYRVAGTGQAGMFYTSGSAYRAIQSNLTDSSRFVTWDFLNNGNRVGYVGWGKPGNTSMLSIGTVNFLGREYAMIRLMDSNRVVIGDTTQLGPPVTDDLTNTLQVNGTVRTTMMPPYSVGGISPIGRNNTTGRFETISGGGGGVSSVGLSMPSEFSVGGSPVTTSGTLAVTKNNQSPNTVYAGPSAGGSAAPTFRVLTPNDIPKTKNVTNINDADYAINTTDDFVIFSSTITANHTVTLPAANTNSGRTLFIVCLEMNGSFQYAPSPSIINNSNTLLTGLGNNSTTTIYSDGTNWRLLSIATH